MDQYCSMHLEMDYKIGCMYEWALDWAPGTYQSSALPHLNWVNEGLGQQWVGLGD